MNSVSCRTSQTFKRALTAILGYTLSGSLIAGLCLLSFAFETTADTQDKGFIGIAMPTKSSARWIADGQAMSQQFKAAGYRVDLQYAEDDIPNQLNQIETMIVKGVDVLVIASIDGTTLYSALENAHASGVSVISYDRLIRGSAHVDYYATFDNFKVGVQQANSLLEGMRKNGPAPYNIELFGGSPDDNNAYFFYDGAMSVLQPLIDSGELVVRSGQMDMSKISILRWDGATAQARMDNLISAHYTQEQIDGVLAPADVLSIGILSSLKGVGYGSVDMPMPVVTGQDADLSSVKSIIAGEQYSTIFKDTRQLAKVTVGMAQALLNNSTPPINDTSSYHNGIKVIPAFLLDPTPVDIQNWRDVLLGSGYYNEAQLQ